MSIDEVLDAIRNAIGRCDRRVPEVDLLRALVIEAADWKMHLAELEEEE